MGEFDALKEFLRRYEKLKLEQIQKPGKDSFTLEFQNVKRECEKMVQEGKTVATEGAKEFNRKKNRYKDILPFDHSRVVLEKVNSEEGTDYINASYILSPEGKKGYIASQGPTPATVSDFWRMAWQHKVKVIVMACKEIELGKHRCQRYWPLEGERLQFDKISVTLIKEKEIAENLMERRLKAFIGKEEMLVTQIHYSAWPDHGAPKTTKDLIQIIQLMRDAHPWDDPPMLIHCSAGCGRTGAIVAVDYGRRIIRKSPPKFNVFELVMSLRKQRPAMVQSKEQYEYLYDVYKDLIIEHIKNSEKASSNPSYVNIDFGANQNAEESAIYENFDVRPKRSPRLSRPQILEISAGNGLEEGKGFVIKENLEQPKKPLLTNTVMMPQKAIINTEIQQKTKPKPVPRPIKPLNLMDSEPRGIPNTDLTSPLLPMPINPAPVTSVGATPVTTVDMKNPTTNEKNFPQQNYVNVEIGPPKLPSKPAVSPTKPNLPLKKSSNPVPTPRTTSSPNTPNNFETPAKPINQSRSQENLLKKASPPKLQTKPIAGKMDKRWSVDNMEMNESRRPQNLFDSVDGKKPPLPLKHKDLADFEAPVTQDAKAKPERIGKQEATTKKLEPSTGTQDMLLGSTKSRTFERNDIKNNNVQSDLWKQYSPDYEVPDYEVGDRKEAGKDYEVMFGDSKSNLPGNKKLNDRVVETGTLLDLSPLSLNVNDSKQTKRNVSPKLERARNAKTHELFEPFEPTSTVRVNTKEIPVSKASQNDPRSKNEPRKHSADLSKQQPLQRDGLVSRTSMSLGRTPIGKDALVSRTKYIVSLEKGGTKEPQARPQQPTGNAPKPAFSKASSAEAIIVNSLKQSVQNVATKPSISSDNKKESCVKEQAVNGIDQVDGLYSQVVNQSPVSNPVTTESVYEAIWTPPTNKHKERPRLNHDGPPELPARTPDSFIVLDKNSVSTDKNKGTSDSEPATPSESSPPSASGEQSSFPWIAAGVGKIKSNFKSAFTIGVRPSPRQTSNSPGITSSAFYTPNPSKGQSTNSPQNQQDTSFGNRLQQKPKGPRPMPGRWQVM